MTVKDYKKLVEEKSKHPENATCVDCKVKNPKWASLRYGVFFCLDCAAIHRSLGVYLDFVKSVNLDEWDKEAYLPIEYGGNKKFSDYLKEKGLYNLETEAKYKKSDVIEYSKMLMKEIEKNTGIVLRSSEKKASGGAGYKNIQPTRNDVNAESPKQTIYSSSSIASSLTNLTSVIGTQVKSITEKTVEYGTKFGNSVKQHAKTLIEKGSSLKSNKEKAENNQYKSKPKIEKSQPKNDWS